jgi:hypothetical protein
MYVGCRSKECYGERRRWVDTCALCGLAIDVSVHKAPPREALGETGQLFDPTGVACYCSLNALRRVAIRLTYGQ